MARLIGLLVLGVVASLTACGKSDGGSEPIALSDLPARAAAIACEGLGNCCRSSGHAFDLATCKQVYTADIEGELGEIDMSRVAYDAEMAGKCLDSMAAQSRCGDLEGDDRYCDLIFRGKTALGQPCTDSQECRAEVGQSVGCTSSDGIQPEVCTLQQQSRPLPRGKLGDACTSTCDEDDDCLSGEAIGPSDPGAPVQRAPVACYRQDGLWCNMGRCASLLEVGEPCPDYYGCKGEAFCHPDSQICTSPRPNGEPCQGSSQCQSRFCDYEQESSPGSGSCAPATTIYAEDCNLDDEADSSAPSPVP